MGSRAAAAGGGGRRRPNMPAHLVMPPCLLDRKQQPLERPAGGQGRRQRTGPLLVGTSAARRPLCSLQLGGWKREDEPHAYFLQQLGGRQPAHGRSCPTRRQRLCKRCGEASDTRSMPIDPPGNASKRCRRCHLGPLSAVHSKPLRGDSSEAKVSVRTEVARYGGSTFHTNRTC